MKKKIYMRLSSVWNGLFQRLRTVGILIMLALLAVSCGTTRKLTESQKVTSDSVVIKEIQIVTTVSVPESKVEMVIPVENLHNLPPGAAYTDKNGQANVKVTARNDSLYVAASCDRLQVQCERYEKELTRIRSDTDRQVTEIKKNSVQTLFKWCLTGFLAGIISTITIIIIKKRKIW